MAASIDDPNYTIIHLREVLKNRPRSIVNLKSMIAEDVGKLEEAEDTEDAEKVFDDQLEVVTNNSQHASLSNSVEMFDLVVEDPLTGENVVIATSDDISRFDGKEIRYSPETETLMIGKPRSNHNYGLRKLNRVLKEIRNTSRTYIIRATVYRYLNILMLAAILAAEAAAIYFTIDENQLASTILQISALSLTGLYGIFKIGQMGIHYRRYAYMLDELYRQGESARVTFDTDEQFDNYANILSSEVAEITYNVFRMTYGPGSEKMAGSKDALQSGLSSAELLKP